MGRNLKKISNLSIENFCIILMVIILDAFGVFETVRLIPLFISAALCLKIAYLLRNDTSDKVDTVQKNGD